MYFICSFFVAGMYTNEYDHYAVGVCCLCPFGFDSVDICINFGPQAKRPNVNNSISQKDTEPAIFW